MWEKVYFYRTYAETDSASEGTHVRWWGSDSKSLISDLIINDFDDRCYLIFSFCSMTSLSEATYVSFFAYVKISLWKVSQFFVKKCNFLFPFSFFPLFFLFLLYSIYIRRKFWIRENFLYPVFDGFTCFEVSWTRFDHF